MVTKQEEFFSAWNSCMHHVTSLSLAHIHRGELALVDCWVAHGPEGHRGTQLWRRGILKPSEPPARVRAPSTFQRLEACCNSIPCLLGKLTRQKAHRGPLTREALVCTHQSPQDLALQHLEFLSKQGEATYTK